MAFHPQICVVTPWSAYGPTHAAVEQFPALLHYFPCNQGAGTYGLKDVVRGVEYAINTYTAPDSASIQPAWSANVTGDNLPLNAGSWQQPGSSGFHVAMWMSKGTTNATYIGFGRSLAHIQEMHVGDGFVYTHEMNGGIENGDASLLTGTYAPVTAIDAAVPSIAGGIWDIDGAQTVTPFWTATDGTYTTDTPVDSSAITDLSNLPAYGSICPGQPGGAGYITNLYFILLMKFTTMPANFGVGIEWMRAAAANGQKAIYPGWEGIT